VNDLEADLETEAPMKTHADTATRVAGAWLAASSLLLVAALALHPPPSPDPDRFMAIIADAGVRWRIAHWFAALALSGFVATSLVALTTPSRLNADGWKMSAWALLAVSAAWVTTTAVAEATVIADAAISADRDTFHAWERFAEGKAMGFLGIAAALALIATTEATETQPATPRWAGWLAGAAGLAAIVGWTLGAILGVDAGAVIWLVSTMVLSLWTLWFGIAIAHIDQAGPAIPVEISSASPRSSGT
jgi:hypothetical protein